MKKNTFVFYVVSTCILLGIIIISYNIEKFSPITKEMSDSQIIEAIKDDLEKAKNVSKEAIRQGIIVPDEDFDEMEDLINQALELEERVENAQARNDKEESRLAKEDLKFTLTRLIKADELLKAQIELLESQIKRNEETIKSKDTSDGVHLLANLGLTAGIAKAVVTAGGILVALGQVAAAVAMGI